MGSFRFLDHFLYIFGLDSSLQHSNQTSLSLLSLPIKPLFPFSLPVFHALCVELRRKMTRVGGGLGLGGLTNQ
jgi:hypothetical protein